MKFCAVVVIGLATVGCVLAAPPANGQEALSDETAAFKSFPDFLQHAIRARATEDEPTTTKTKTTTSTEAATTTATADETETGTNTTETGTNTTATNTTATATSTSTSTGKPTSTKTTETAKPTSTAKPSAAPSKPGEPCEKWEDYKPEDPDTCKLTSDQVTQFFSEMNGGGGDFDVSSVGDGEVSMEDLVNPNAPGGAGVILGMGDR